MSEAGFWTDASGRLTFDLPSVSAMDYPAVCRSIIDSFSLSPVASLLIGPDQMFWNFRRDDQEVGLDWDNWMGFMVVAKSVNAEPLVRGIAEWLRTTQLDRATKYP